MARFRTLTMITLISGSLALPAGEASAAAIPPAVHVATTGVSATLALVGLEDRVAQAKQTGAAAVDVVQSLVAASWSRYNVLGDRSMGALSNVAEELRCLALNIYHEARGEPRDGQYAVGHVVMNRVSDSRYPNSICGVVNQGLEYSPACQFSWMCDGRSDQPTDRDAWRASMRMAMEIYLGYSEDPTGGAMWYHADYVSPSWRTMFKRGPKIGAHIFYQRQAGKRL